MSLEIRTIPLTLPFRLGSVNCYLLKTDSGNILIDSGASKQQGALEKALEENGCEPGSLKLIVITHGDFDHTGNAAFLRSKYGAKIAMHADDAGMAERGDMFRNRKSGNFILRAAVTILFGFGKSKRFTADVHIEEGSDLSAYGFDGRVLNLPGHSKGSIGILTNSGELFCGDLLENTHQPDLNIIIDDLAAAVESAERLISFKIKTVYPGHGKPFPLDLALYNMKR